MTFTNDELFIMKEHYESLTEDFQKSANKKGLKTDSHGETYGAGYFDYVKSRKYNAIFEKLETMWENSNAESIDLEKG